MADLQAVLFDLDDTLYLEREYVFSGFRAVAQWAEGHLGLDREEGFHQLKAFFDRGVRGDTFNRWLESQGMEAEVWVHRLVEVYRNHTPRIQPCRDVLPALDYLKGRVRLGLVTEGFIPAQEKKLDALGIQPYFEGIQITGYEDRDRWKPDPYPFLQVLDRLGVPAEKSLHLGDNPLKDFIGARALGMWTVRIARPGGLNSSLESPTPDHRAHTRVTGLEEFLQWLKRENLMDR